MNEFTPKAFANVRDQISIFAINPVRVRRKRKPLQGLALLLN